MQLAGMLLSLILGCVVSPYRTRVYVDSAIGVETVPLGNLPDHLADRRPLTRVAASTASLVLKTQRDFPAVIAVSYKIHDKNSKKKKKKLSRRGFSLDYLSGDTPESRTCLPVPPL